MKKLQLLIILVLLFNIEGFSQTNDSQYDFKILVEEQWLEFDSMLIALKTENRINNSDAGFLKSLSSNSFVAFEQTSDSVVNQYGKLNEEDIQLTFRITSTDNDYLIIVTSFLGFCHSFKYDIPQRKLSRISIKDKIILSATEVIKFKKLDNSLIIFYADNSHFKKSDWIKYFSLDLKNDIFTHTKNCRTVENEEYCKIIGG